MTADILRLREILAGMDLPALRVEQLDKGWLMRNIAIKNSDNKDFNEAILILKKL